MIFAAAVLQILLQRLFSLAQEYFLYLVRCSHLHSSEISFHLRSYLFKIIVSFSFLCKACPPLTTFEFRKQVTKTMEKPPKKKQLAFYISTLLIFYQQTKLREIFLFLTNFCRTRFLFLKINLFFIILTWLKK